MLVMLIRGQLSYKLNSRLIVDAYLGLPSTSTGRKVDWNKCMFCQKILRMCPTHWEPTGGIAKPPEVDDFSEIET